MLFGSSGSGGALVLLYWQEETTWWHLTYPLWHLTYPLISWFTAHWLSSFLVMPFSCMPQAHAKYIALPVTAVPLPTLAYPVVWLHWRSLISFRIIFVIAVVEYLVRNNLRSKRFVLAYGLKVHCSGKDMAVIEGPVAAQGSRRLLTWFLSWWTRKQKDGISGS